MTKLQINIGRLSQLKNGEGSVNEKFERKGNIVTAESAKNNSIFKVVEPNLETLNLNTSCDKNASMNNKSNKIIRVALKNMGKSSVTNNN